LQTSREHHSIIKAHEGLRGLASLGIALFHASTIDSMAPGLKQISLIHNAWISVDLFFVLSGFVMFLRYGSQLQTSHEATGFVLRRFGRLYPLHLVTLILFLVVWMAMQTVKWLLLVNFDVTVGHQPLFDPEQVNGLDLLSNVLLLHGVGLHWTDALNYPSWTVSLEMWTYLVFLMVCMVASRPASRIWIFVLLGAASFGWFIHKAMTIDGFVAFFQAERSYMRILMSFSIGVIAAVWHQRRRTIGSGVGWAQALAVGAVIVYLAVLQQSEQWLLIGPVLFGLLVLSLSSDEGWLARGLSGRVCGWLGERSYSIYLIHATLLMAFSALARLTPGPAQWALFGAYLLAVLGAAQVLYTRIEVPWRDRFRDLAASRSQGPNRVASNRA